MECARKIITTLLCYNIKMKKSICFLCSAIVAVCFFSSAFKYNSSVALANDFWSKAVIKNAVVYLTFEEEGNNYADFDEDFFAKIEKMYVSSPISVKNYYLTQSNGALTVETTFFGEDDCIRATHGAAYYKPRYEWKNNEYKETNADGYDNRWYDSDGNAVEPTATGAKQGVEGALREQLLIREVLSKCDADSYDGDYDRDGLLDSLVIITDSGSADDTDWGEVLWSHMGVAHSFPESVLKNYYYTRAQLAEIKSLTDAMLGKAFAAKYNFLSAGEICKRKTSDYSTQLKDSESVELYDIGLLCHEMGHNLGLYDYYSYEDLTYESVGEFDVLANYTPVPQNMLSYLRLKMGWLTYDDILYVNSSDTYTLYPSGSGSGKSCAKIVLSNYMDTEEYFMLEVRSRSFPSADKAFDSCLSGDGLLVYRVSEKNAYINANGNIGNSDYGNMYGDDEVYVFRKTADDGTTSKKLTEPQLGVNCTIALLGDKTLSSWSDKFGSKEFSNNVIRYTNGENSSIAISDVKVNDDYSVTFTVSLPDDPKSTIMALDMSQCKITRHYDGTQRIFWSSNVKNGKAYLIALRSTDRLRRLAESSRSEITIADIKKGRFSYYRTLYTAEVPLAEKNMELPEFEDNALLFLALETDDGLKTIRYVGEMKIEDETFSQYMARVFDPIYIFIVIGVVLLIIVAIVLLISSKRTLKRRKS